MAGYSGTPLVKKLGIKPGQRVLFLNAPADYGRTLGKLPDGIRAARGLSGSVDFIQVFATRKSELRSAFEGARQHLAADGAIWVSWPKRASGVGTDLSENIVRETGLAAGMVDVKVCAVDETWSGLKFVYRLRDRKLGGPAMV